MRQEYCPSQPEKSRIKMCNISVLEYVLMKYSPYPKKQEHLWSQSMDHVSVTNITMQLYKNLTPTCWTDKFPTAKTLQVWRQLVTYISN